MTATANIHATCIVLAAAAPAPSLAAAGVLLLGDSGAGKSDLALRLIDRGARLVSDDRTNLYVEDGRLHARAPAALAGLIEIRGLGIVALPCEASAQIALAAQLATDVPRMPLPQTYAPPLALAHAARPPLIRINAYEASAVPKLRWAVYALHHGLLRNDGAP